MRDQFSKKTPELVVVIEQHKSDVILVTKTWLTNDVPDQSVNITGFNLTRKDRTTGRGGGVAIYVKETIPLKVRSDRSNEDYECLWIILRPKWLPRSISRIAVACVYIPPSTV
jgi:exonuclease III